MWQKELINLGLDVFKKTTKVTRKTVQARAPLFGRTIRQAGNGKERVVVGGFTGPNLDTVNHNKLVQRRISMNIRPVVTGFTGIPGIIRFKQMTGMPNRGWVRFFPNFRLPKMTRHVVSDVKTSRKVVTGFSSDVSKEKIVTKGNIVPSPANPVKPPEVATERVVVQGFGGNPQNKITKPLNPQKNDSPRTIVRGFRV